MIRQQDIRTIGYERDYPGSYGWEISEYRCADCGKWTTEISGMASVNDDGSETAICEKCSEKTEYHD